MDFGPIELRNPRYAWDDARVDEDFTVDVSPVLSAALKMSVRARMVLAVGLYEWVVWRFEGLYTRKEPRQILDVAWCGTVDPRYLNTYEFAREEWVGPIEGPIWCAMAYLNHGLPKGYGLEGDLYDALEYLYGLTYHVVPNRSGLEQWLRPTLDRLVARYPPTAKDPLDDLFDHRIGEHMGPLIGRDTLDPRAAVDVERDRRFLAQVLSVAREEETPFLATLEELEEEGFEGEPYVLPAPTT